MTWQPILASNTTAAAVEFLVLLFCIAVGVGAVPGLVSLALLCRSRKGQSRKIVGMVLGLSSIAAGTMLMLLLIPAEVEFIGWLTAAAPLIIGVIALVLWSIQKQERVSPKARED